MQPDTRRVARAKERWPCRCRCFQHAFSRQNGSVVVKMTEFCIDFNERNTVKSIYDRWATFSVLTSVVVNEKAKNGWGKIYFCQISRICNLIYVDCKIFESTSKTSWKYSVLAQVRIVKIRKILRSQSSLYARYFMLIIERGKKFGQISYFELISAVKVTQELRQYWFIEFLFIQVGFLKIQVDKTASLDKSASSTWHHGLSAWPLLGYIWTA